MIKSSICKKICREISGGMEILMMKNMLKCAAAFMAAAVVTLAGTYDIYAAGTRIPSAAERGGSSVTSTQAPKSSAEASAEPSSSAKPSASTKPSGTEKPVSADRTAAPVQQPVVTSGTVDHENCVTKLGAFGWFILSVIVNLIISFAIGYRFYRMSKRDNHILAEMRAIKKDIDAKMQANIGGFSEYETRVNNKNRSYAKAETNIKSSYVQPEDDGAQEIYKKWEAQLGGDIKAEQEPETSGGQEPDLETIARSITVTERSEPRRSEGGVRRSEPRRRTEPRQSKRSEHKDSVASKLKGLINNVLPFDDDEE